MCFLNLWLCFIFAWLALTDGRTEPHDMLSNYVSCSLWFGLNLTQQAKTENFNGTFVFATLCKVLLFDWIGSFQKLNVIQTVFCKFSQIQQFKKLYPQVSKMQT